MRHRHDMRRRGMRYRRSAGAIIGAPTCRSRLRLRFEAGWVIPQGAGDRGDRRAMRARRHNTVAGGPNQGSIAESRVGHFGRGRMVIAPARASWRPPRHARSMRKTIAGGSNRRSSLNDPAAKEPADDASAGRSKHDARGEPGHHRKGENEPRSGAGPASAAGSRRRLVPQATAAWLGWTGMGGPLGTSLCSPGTSGSFRT
jgi:hypothetical protein